MNVSDLLASEASIGRITSIARVALSQKYSRDNFPIYFSALSQALDQEPPPFASATYSELYRNASSDAGWMAISLITNAEREGDGATRLWSLSACSSNNEEQQRLKAHAVDESRHALMYLSMLDLAFPGMTEPGFRRELRKLSPGYSMRMELFPVKGSPYAKEPTIDDFLQMNIAEIRTTIHHIMQRASLSNHAPIKKQDQIKAILDSLLRDELSHVAYTASIIEQRARACPEINVSVLFQKRFRDFNQITTEELGENAFDCSVACCAKRPHCRSKVGPAEFIDTPI
jgi:hypothetical protein